MRTLLLYTLIILISLSCKKENPSFPDTGRKIVVNCLLSTDSLIGVNICGSLYIKDTSNFVKYNFIDNAKVEIFENENYLDSLIYIDLRWSPSLTNSYLIPNNYRSKTFFPSTGKQYQIRIKAPKKPDAIAITTIPNLVKIEKVDTTRIILTNVDYWQSKIKFACNIFFTDPAGEKNYYLF